MAYNVEVLLDDAIRLLESDDTVITDLQVYGKIGVSNDYFYSTMMKSTSDKSATIKNLLQKNRALASKFATDRIREIAEKGLIKDAPTLKATTTLARIADQQVCKALSPRIQEEDKDEDDDRDKDAVMKDVERILDDFVAKKSK